MNTDNPLDMIKLRPAVQNECRTVAELFRISSDGVADYIWTLLAEHGESIIDVGTKRYENEESLFSYKNCTVAELDGTVAGMLCAFPMHESEEEDHLEPDPVLTPYMKLEQYGSYYIAGMALFPEFRGKGIGTKLLKLAEDHAVTKNLPQVSLIVFEQNEGAKRLYERSGYYEVKREPIVPHELIHYKGDVVLMVKDLASL